MTETLYKVLGEEGEAVNLILRGSVNRQIEYGGDIRKVGERLIRLADELERIKAGIANGD